MVKGTMGNNGLFIHEKTCFLRGYKIFCECIKHTNDTIIYFHVSFLRFVSFSYNVYVPKGKYLPVRNQVSQFSCTFEYL